MTRTSIASIKYKIIMQPEALELGNDSLWILCISTLDAENLATIV